MQTTTQRSGFKRIAMLATIVVGGLFSVASSALPVPPSGSGWLVYTYYGPAGRDGIEKVVGMRYQGAGCPGPRPLDWGQQTAKFSWHYANCNANQN
ncbi:hypothetical protein [Lysobacter sp. Root690]|uniref:hypothetical protein n=1 Tax=Lysobacter sp. Root690 TaxID=1736588 RepID=UPI0006FE435E|nr:hypothetical protein [Lysobacter sp. Root690]KRB06847.1 hypothetical protein ASD86_12630 [Lysobacter sp. Root690]